MARQVNATYRIAVEPTVVSEKVAIWAARAPGAQISVNGSTVQIATREIPTWAWVLAFLGSAFFLVGLLFLLVKETSVLTVSALPVEGGSTVIVSGKTSEQVIAQLVALFTTAPALTA